MKNPETCDYREKEIEEIPNDEIPDEGFCGFYELSLYTCCEENCPFEEDD